MQWYCLKTKPRQETIAHRHLGQQSFEVYFPKIQIERLRKGRITTDIEPLFPGYLLVRFTLNNPNWRAINGTRGVLKLLSSEENGRPSALPDAEVQSIQTRERKGELRISEIKRVKRGDKVRFKFGQYSEAIGRVLYTRQERVHLLLYLLGRQTLVKAPLHLVDLVAVR